MAKPELNVDLVCDDAPVDMAKMQLDQPHRPSLRRRLCLALAKATSRPFVCAEMAKFFQQF